MVLRTANMLVVRSTCSTPILFAEELRLRCEDVSLVDLLLVPVALCRTLINVQIDPVCNRFMLRLQVLLNGWLVGQAV